MQHIFRTALAICGLALLTGGFGSEGPTALFVSN